MLQSLRPLLTKILNPLAKNLNINLNIVTVISPFIAVIAAWGFANHLLILSCIAILASGFLDVVGGAVARYHNRSSKFGPFLDSTMDRFADAIIYIGIIFGGYCCKSREKFKSGSHIDFVGKEKEVYGRAIDYWNDSKYYLEKREIRTAFGCIEYSHCLLDALRMIREII